MKILILGHGRHGKDTAAALMSPLSFRSSSEAAFENAVYPHIGSRYDNKEACYADRHNHRMEWFNLISDYNRDDPCRLAKLVISTSDIYVGMRSLREYQGCVDSQLFDHVVWVDASQRIMSDDESMKIPCADSFYIIDNNKTEDDLRESVAALMTYLKVT